MVFLVVCLPFIMIIIDPFCFKINFAKFLFAVPYMYESLPACLSGTHGSQNLWVPLKLELGLVVSRRVGARNQTLVL